MKAFVLSHWKKLLAAALISAAGYLATGEVNLKPLFQLFPSLPAANVGDAG